MDQAAEGGGRWHPSPYRSFGLFESGAADEELSS